MVAQSMQHEEPESISYAEVEYHGNLIIYILYNACTYIQ